MAIKQNKFSGNQYWTNVLWRVHKSDIIPLSGPKYLWDARFPSSVILNSSLVDQWVDLYQNIPLFLYFGEDLSKAPTYDSSTISFNGVNNYLAQALNEPNPEFTFMIVTGNFSDNLANNPGTFAWLDMNEGYLTMQYIGENQIGIATANAQVGVFEAQPNQVMIVQYIAGGTTLNVYQNGGTPAQLNGVNIGSGLGFLDIGAFLGDQHLAGNVSWIAYYDTAISTDELNTALDYISENFNITTTPIS